MSDMLRKIISALMGAAVVLAATGCVNHHEEAMNAATMRWLTMRSSQMLSLARQQFEAGDLEQAEKTVVEAMGIDQENSKLHVLAARIGLERGQLERSFHLLEKAIEFDDKLPEAYYYKGLVMQRWRQSDSALEAYEKAYELEADNVAYLLAVGEMIVAVDRVDEAIALFEGKLTYFEQNAGLREGIGRMYMLKGSHETAVDYLRQAALLQPDDLQIREALALSQLAAGQFHGAARDLELLCGRPEVRERRDLKHHLIRAYQASGRLNAARAACVEFTRNHPRDAEAWRLQAELAWAQQDLAATLTAADRFRKLASDRPEGFILAGMVWQKRGHSKRALQMYERAMRADRKSVKPVILRGIALEEAGRLADAAKAYREALRLRPDDDRAKKLLAAVEADS